MTDQLDEQIGASGQKTQLDPRSAEEAVTAAGARDLRAPSQVEALEQELAATQREVAASQDKFLRARADMENYKKRIERTYAELTKSSKKDLLRKVLSVKDNLERALQFGEDAETASESVLEGVRLTQYQLDQMLQQEGVTPIDAEGKPFDPYTEEAIQTMNDPNVPDHTVVQVVRTGYTYQDEVLRPAQVIVSVHAQG